MLFFTPPPNTRVSSPIDRRYSLWREVILIAGLSCLRLLLSHNEQFPHTITDDPDVSFVEVTAVSSMQALVGSLEFIFGANLYACIAQILSIEDLNNINLLNVSFQSCITNEFYVQESTL